MINACPNEMYDRALRQAPIMTSVQKDRPSLEAAIEELEKIVADMRSRFDALAVRLTPLTFAEPEVATATGPDANMPPALARLSRLADEVRTLSNQIGSVSRRLAL